MICPNCDKSYHWCWNCCWPAGEIACSYECARALWREEKISSDNMLLWSWDYINELKAALKSKDMKSRPAKTVKISWKDEE